MSIKLNFAKKVYYGRKAKKLTQEELAEKVSVTPRWLQRIEKGAIPSGIVTLKLISALDLDCRNIDEE